MPEPSVPSPSGTGNVSLKKVGHTVGTKYGSNPLAKERGASNPSEISISGKSK